MIYLVLFVLAILISFLIYIGLFHPISLVPSKLGPYTIFYLEYIGPYHKIGPIFVNVAKDTRAFFKFALPFGIYYDNPNNIADKSKCRAVVGIILNSGEADIEEKKTEFQKSHTKYKFGELPIVDCIKTEFPWKGWPTTLLFPRIYNKFNPYIDNNSGPMMEIYRCSGQTGLVEISMVKGEQREAYMLSNSEKPEDKKTK